MAKERKHPLKNKFLFMMCYSLLLLLITFVLYLEYQWYTASNHLPEVVFNLNSLGQGY